MHAEFSLGNAHPIPGQLGLICGRRGLLRALSLTLFHPQRRHRYMADDAGCDQCPLRLETLHRHVGLWTEDPIFRQIRRRYEARVEQRLQTTDICTATAEPERNEASDHGPKREAAR